MMNAVAIARFTTPAARRCCGGVMLSSSRIISRSDSRASTSALATSLAASSLSTTRITPLVANGTVKTTSIGHDHKQQQQTILAKSLSTQSSAASSSSSTQRQHQQPTVFEFKDGKRMATISLEPHPRLKPYIVKRRINRLRTYEGSKKNIRYSPYRLNLICQLVAGLPLQEALTQVQFCDKAKAPLVQQVLRRTANLADIRDGLQPSQLEVAECFATHGTHLKRMTIMGRGRTGKRRHRHAHLRLVLREIDFKLKFYLAPTLNQKKKWLQLWQYAEHDKAVAERERDELAALERTTREHAAEKEAEK